MGASASVIDRLTNEDAGEPRTLEDAKAIIAKQRAVLRVMQRSDIPKLARGCCRAFVATFQEQDDAADIERMYRSFLKENEDERQEAKIQMFLTALKRRNVKSSELPEALRTLDANRDGVVTLDELLADPESGNLHNVRLSQFLPTKDRIDAATECIASVFREWRRKIAESYLENGAPQETFDEETREAMRAGGLDPSRILGNSRCFWDDDGGMIQARNRIFSECCAAFGLKSWNERQAKTSKHQIIGYLVRLTYELRHDDNVGAVVLKNMTGADGQPIILFRSQAMPDIDSERSCYRRLLDNATGGRVQHVFNLYAGHFPVGAWLDKEKAIAEEVRNASKTPYPTYDDERMNPKPRRWRELVDEESEWAKAENRETAMALCAHHIRQILRPGGRPPRGNILVHCCGGMHRTGMIVAIIRRYVNDDPIDVIMADYKRHVDWKDAKRPGGYEALNEKFIREFDLSLLHDDMENVRERCIARREHFPRDVDRWGMFRRNGRAAGRGFAYCVCRDANGPVEMHQTRAE